MRHSMRLRIPNSVQFRLARGWFRLAIRFRNLPNSSWLRTIRRDERKQARRDYKDTRPPAGVELHFLCFRMMESFQVNELEGLRRGLESLFPDLRDVSYYQDF